MTEVEAPSNARADPGATLENTTVPVLSCTSKLVKLVSLLMSKVPDEPLLVPKTENPVMLVKAVGAAAPHTSSLLVPVPPAMVCVAALAIVTVFVPVLVAPLNAVTVGSIETVTLPLDVVDNEVRSVALARFESVRPAAPLTVMLLIAESVKPPPSCVSVLEPEIVSDATLENCVRAVIVDLVAPVVTTKAVYSEFVSVIAVLAPFAVAALRLLTLKFSVVAVGVDKLSVIVNVPPVPDSDKLVKALDLITDDAP